MIASPSNSAIVSAVEWVEQLALGSLATTIAVISVATIGLLMLTGRINVRRFFTVALGCFLVFGARTIVAGLQATTNEVGSMEGLPTAMAMPPLPAPLTPLPPLKRSDPYSGAAVPHEDNGNPWGS